MQIWAKWGDAHGFYDDRKEDDEERSKSLLFNAFIFMQVFNEINSRKILDEYNVFAGIQRSPIFLGVLIITVVLQIIIVQTPVSYIFHVQKLNGAHFAACQQHIYEQRDARMHLHGTGVACIERYCLEHFQMTVCVCTYTIRSRARFACVYCLHSVCVGAHCACPSTSAMLVKHV